MSISARLAELGIALPPVAAPVASYVPATRVDGLIRTSGQLPLIDGELPAKGKVGADVPLEDAKGLARVAALNALAAAADLVSGVDAIERVVHVTVFVSSAPDFTDQAIVANGASQVLGEIFGDAGRHSRSAVGVAVLPLDTPVEVEVQFQTSSLPNSDS